MQIDWGGAAAQDRGARGAGATYGGPAGGAQDTPPSAPDDTVRDCWWRTNNKQQDNWSKARMVFLEWNGDGRTEAGALGAGAVGMGGCA
jgi:hypothetical protein